MNATLDHTNRSLTSEERMQIIAGRFPSIGYLPFVKQWDANALDKWALTTSHGERCAAQFCLSVWNSSHAWSCGVFDLMDAYSVWDDRHRRAFLAWAHNPVFL